MARPQIKLAALFKTKTRDEWCDIMAQRMITLDLAKIKYSLPLAKQYNLPCEKIENTLSEIGDAPQPRHIAMIHEAKTRLVDLLHDCQALSELEANLYHARATLCGCDGAICRLINTGQQEAAQRFGDDLLPLATEVTRLRLELKRGRAEESIEASKIVLRQASDLLDTIRTKYNRKP